MRSNEELYAELLAYEIPKLDIANLTREEIIKSATSALIEGFPTWLTAGDENPRYIAAIVPAKILEEYLATLRSLKAMDDIAKERAKREEEECERKRRETVEAYSHIECRYCGAAVGEECKDAKSYVHPARVRDVEMARLSR